MSFETTKAIRRRLSEVAFTCDGVAYEWAQIFKGRGIDVGCGADKLPFANCVGFDTNDSDVNRLSTFFPSESFDYVHGSHVIEHIISPQSVLRDWLVLAKPGGFVIQTVLDVGAYERFTHPSRFNPDRCSSFSLVYRGSFFPIHCDILAILETFKDVAKVLLARYVEENYDWKAPMSLDRTCKREAAVKIWNEFVMQSCNEPSETTSASLTTASAISL